MEGNPHGYTEAVFGDGVKGGSRTDGHPALPTGAALAQKSTPDVADNYNREHAWTDVQHDKSHPKEFTDETAKITQGGYTVAAQHRTALAQKSAEELYMDKKEANKNYKLNYLGALRKGYTESQAKNFAGGERDMALSTYNGVYNWPQNGPAAYAQTPDTPDDYNREHAWTDNQAIHYNEKEYLEETAKPAGYQKLLGA